MAALNAIRFPCFLAAKIFDFSELGTVNLMLTAATEGERGTLFGFRVNDFFPIRAFTVTAQCVFAQTYETAIVFAFLASFGLTAILDCSGVVGTGSALGGAVSAVRVTF